MPPLLRRVLHGLPANAPLAPSLLPLLLLAPGRMPDRGDAWKVRTDPRLSKICQGIGGTPPKDAARAFDARAAG